MKLSTDLESSHPDHPRQRTEACSALAAHDELDARRQSFPQILEEPMSQVAATL